MVNEISHPVKALRTPNSVKSSINYCYLSREKVEIYGHQVAAKKSWRTVRNKNFTGFILRNQRASEIKMERPMSPPQN